MQVGKPFEHTYPSLHLSPPHKGVHFQSLQYWLEVHTCPPHESTHISLIHCWVDKQLTPLHNPCAEVLINGGVKNMKNMNFWNNYGKIFFWSKNIYHHLIITEK